MLPAFPFAAVLFDLDGVVIDTTELHYRVWDEFARARGYTPNSKELLATNGRRAAETIRRWIGKELNDDEIATLTAEREARFNRLLATEPVSAVAGVKSYIAKLATAGIPRAVATSAVPANATLSLTRLGMEDAFDVVITAADVHRGKPDPEGYLKAAAALKIRPADCVIIEDSVSGIQAARASGARCLALTTTFPRETLAAEKPDWLARDFLSLPAPFHV